MKYLKTLALVCFTGMMYVAMEVVARAFRGEMVGCHGLEYQSLAGWSSIWLVFIGGLCAVTIGALNETKIIPTPVWFQCLVGTIFVFIIEMVMGLILNVWLHLQLWDYSSWPLNILGQVTLVYVPVWFLVCPVAIYVDDVLKYVWFDDHKPKSLLSLYKDLFRGR
jgi:hypothetical protein